MSDESIIPERARWFVRDRFGLFIHWGLYSLPARHEWVQSIEMLTEAQYRRYFERFDPDLYDPAAWARMARRAWPGAPACAMPSSPPSITMAYACGTRP